MVAVVRRALEERGFHVVVPEHFLQIPRYLEVHQPRVIVLDLQMPAINGVQVGEFLRRHGCQVPVILYSSVDLQALEEAARKIGASAYLSKEAPVEALVALVERFCSPSPGAIQPRG